MSRFDVGHQTMPVAVGVFPPLHEFSRRNQGSQNSRSINLDPDCGAPFISERNELGPVAYRIVDYLQLEVLPVDLKAAPAARQLRAVTLELSLSLGARACLATALRTNCLQPRKVDKESLTTESRAPMRKSLRKSSRRFRHGGVGYHPCLSSSGSRRQTLLALLRCAVPSPSTAVRDPPRVPRSRVQSRAIWCLGSAPRFLPERGCG